MQLAVDRPALLHHQQRGLHLALDLAAAGDLEAAAGILDAFGGTPPVPGATPASEPDALVLQVLDALKGEGFDACLMPLGDAFSLDIAVTHPDTGLYALGVEIDSPRHPLLQQARAREVWRPKLLARSGLKLHRIQSSAWVQDRAGQCERLILAARAAIAGGKAE